MHYGDVMKISETSEDYEKLAQKIYEDILALEGVENIEVQHNVKIKGKSGVEHQIDVFWEYRYAGITHKVLIECKHYGHRVSLLHVRNLHGLLTDIPNSSGILVTTVGYQSGAEEYAKFYEMSLKRIRKPVGEDWNGCIQITKINGRILRNNYLGFDFEFDRKHELTREIAKNDTSVTKMISTDIVIKDNGEEPCSFNAWLDRNIAVGEDGFDIELEKVILPEDSFVLVSNDRELKLKKVVVKYSSTEILSSIEVDAMNFVEAVLEDFTTGTVEHMLKKNA
jgi:hypothetical protein